VCVRKRDREREGEREGEREKSESVCECARVSEPSSVVERKVTCRRRRQQMCVRERESACV
jgi:hypothetical protein